MNIERMRILERVLVEVIEQGRRFNMDLWENEGSCGTMCCAGGWLCRDPQAQEQGLEMLHHEPHLVDPDGSGHWGFSALEVWLDLDHSESLDLFSCDGYRALESRRRVLPGEVLRKVRQYISEMHQ